MKELTEGVRILMQAISDDLSNTNYIFISDAAYELYRTDQLSVEYLVTHTIIHDYHFDTYIICKIHNGIVTCSGIGETDDNITLLVDELAIDQLVELYDLINNNFKIK